MPDLKQLPFKDYDIFDFQKIIDAKNGWVGLMGSRGCPYSCSYCDRSVFRRSFRFNSAEYLYEHLRYLRERFGIRHINFYDDQFTFNRQRVEDERGGPLSQTPGSELPAEAEEPWPG